MTVLRALGCGLAAAVSLISITSAQPIPQLAGDIPTSFSVSAENRDYTRQEVMIPMRDGVKLHTVIITPRVAAGPSPILLTRTPYGLAEVMRDASPRAVMNLPLADGDYILDGYIRVYQDIRGRHGSEGAYILNSPLRGPHNPGPTDQSTDTWDTIDWLVNSLPHNNAQVGLTGVSYDGLLTLMGLVDPHPALKAAAPMYPMADGWKGEDFYHNGAFRQGYFDWMYGLITSKGGGDPIWGHYDLWHAFLDAQNADGVARQHGIADLPAWRRLIENAAYTPYWRDQALQDVLSDVELRTPVLMIHGLFDQEGSFGGLAVYKALEGKDVGNRMNYLVLGPWSHGQSQNDGSALGPLQWGSDTSLYARRTVVKPFFDQHLKGKAPAAPIPPVTVFETGVNEWRAASAWPLSAQPKQRLYLLPGGKLGFNSPSDHKESFAEYISDPAKPVPYRRRPIRPVYAADSTWSQWLVDDQRDFGSRPDVLTFVSEPLTEPLTISGDVVATLFASTTGSDADWIVKLIDVQLPEVRAQVDLGGYELMISGDILRGRYREDPSVAKPIPPGEVLPYVLRMPAVNHTFLPGHRIMVQVQSSWFPLYDRNPQTFVPEIAKAPPGAYRAAQHRIYIAPGVASFVEMPVVEGR